MHGSYRRAFGPENVVELHKNIIIQHDDYLKHDDQDKKADALRYMAGYVVQYLHLVPQEKKFTFKETERLLHNSAMNIAEFDPREGSLAFCNLAKYAENLLEQPWRKDFHVIKLTSGFYVHNIAAQLQNAHEILIVMGYVNIDDTTLKLIPNQNFANLKAVSRDCYVASQECLILSQIWQHVADMEPDYPLTIGEVFEYRKNHLGDTETICNKLLYDIRMRMHEVKKQQQLQLHLPQSHMKNTQRFVPVERLIDFDGDEGTNPDEPDRPHHSFVPEREVDSVHDQLKNVNLYSYNDDEHIYDPVYGGDVPTVPVHLYQRKKSHPQASPQKSVNNAATTQQYFYNNSSRKSAPASYLQQQQQYQQHNNFNSNTNNVMMLYGSDRNSVSPMIPKTVTSLFSNQSSSRNNVSKSNSMNSINGGVAGRGANNSSSSSSSMSHNFSNVPLVRSKVRETDLDADLMGSPRDAIAPYFNTNNDNRNNRHQRKTMPPSIPTNNHTNQVFPDQFYPAGIVKPVAVYGSSANPPPGTIQNPYYPRTRLHSDNSEDVLNEAYAYASEVGQLPKGAGPPGHMVMGVRQGPLTPGQQAYQHQATPIPPIHGSDSESQSESHKLRNSSSQRELAQEQLRLPNTARSGSSTDASSSWDGSVREAEYNSSRQQNNVNRLQSRKSEQTPKRPSHIDLRGSQIRHADSSPESELVQPQQQQQSKNKNGYRELSSSSSGGSPASTSSRNYPRNEELNSLDTVYFDYLLKQGQTDEVLGSGSGGESRNNKSNLNHSNNDQNEVVSTHRRTGSSSRSSSSQHHHHHPPQNNYSSGNEHEENHMYDGRRVVPKKQHNNDTVIRRRQNPVESTIPSVLSSKSDPNYNLLSNSGEVTKPSHEKHVRKSSNQQHPSRNSERVPNESEDPSMSTSPPPKKPVEPWDCRFCTFRNLVEERICEVCAKSKDFFEDVEPQPPIPNLASQQPMPMEQQQLPKMYSVPNTSYVTQITGAVGGGGGGATAVAGVEQEEEKECPQCTLLNPVRARVCDACNYRLKPVESPKNLEDLPFDNR